MRTSVGEQRRLRRWRLRRLEAELPLRLPVERLHPDDAATLTRPLLTVTAPDAVSQTLAVEEATARAKKEALALGAVGHRECRPVVDLVKSVPLDTVRIHRAADGASSRRRSSSEATVTRRHVERPGGLSLVERLLLVLQPPLESLLRPTGILEWPDDLREYQRDGVHALVESDALLLADDMGLGKTVQAIAAFRVLVHWGRAERALIVVPASLVLQWERELRRWAPELRTTVVRGPMEARRHLWRSRAHAFVVSYETLRQDAETPPGPAAYEWDVVILDEAQRIKNPRTKAAHACKRLARHRAWALTGTPLENDLDELASIVQFLTPLAPGDRQPPALSGLELQRRHRELQLRRRKQDVLRDLPRKSVNDIWLELGERQRRAYDRAEQEGVVHLRELGEDVTIGNVLALIQKLKQICNVCPESGESAKLDDLVYRIEEITAEGARVLVFSQYVDDAYGVRGICRQLGGLEPLAYHGSLSQRQKDEVLTKFKTSSRHKALVLSLRAGGHGLNLPEASYVVHFDRWWNPAFERQAEDRAHRLGQTSAVTVYRYMCVNTIEERIDRILREKQHLFDQYVDRVSIDPGKLLGEEAIFGLFDLKPPKRGGGSATEELPL